MKSKDSFHLSLFVFSTIGVFFSLVIIFLSPKLIAKGSYQQSTIITPIKISQKITENKQSTSTQNVIFSEQKEFGLPIHLTIPKIKVDTVFEHVGLTSDGAMDVPKKQENVAWFNLWPIPGEIGNAVIAGHYGWKGGKPSAFDNLYKLRIGDKIYIKDDKGQTITFVVRELRRYDENAEATDVFYSDDGKAHLNLITCEGVWNKDTKSYSKRLVVFTDKE